MRTVAKHIASLDLRFPDKESEGAFVKSLEQNIVWATVLAAALWVVAGTLRIAEAGVRGRVGDAQLWSHLVCCLLSAAFAGLVVLRSCCASLARWNWELLAASLLSCLAWQVAAVVAGGGSETRYTLAQSNLFVAVGASVPLRSVVAWIIPTSALLANAVHYAALTHGSDEECLVDVFAALCVSVLAHSGARRHERVLRSAWKSGPCEVEPEGTDRPSKSNPCSEISDSDGDDVERSAGVLSIVPALPGAVAAGSSAWPPHARPPAAAQRAADGTRPQGGQVRPELQQLQSQKSILMGMGSADGLCTDLESQASAVAGLDLLREERRLPLPSASKRQQVVATQAEELRVAQAALEAMRGELGAAHAALEASRGELGATQAALEASRAELRAAQQALEASQAEVGEAQRECTEAGNTVQEEFGQRQRMEERLRKSVQVIHGLCKALELAEANNSERPSRPREGAAGLRLAPVRPAARKSQRKHTAGSQKPPFMPKRAERMEFPVPDLPFMPKRAERMEFPMPDWDTSSAFSSEAESSQGKPSLEDQDPAVPSTSTSLKSFSEFEHAADVVDVT